MLLEVMFLQFSQELVQSFSPFVLLMIYVLKHGTKASVFMNANYAEICGWVTWRQILNKFCLLIFSEIFRIQCIVVKYQKFKFSKGN